MGRSSRRPSLRTLGAASGRAPKSTTSRISHNLRVVDASAKWTLTVPRRGAPRCCADNRASGGRCGRLLPRLASAHRCAKPSRGAFRAAGARHARQLQHGRRPPTCMEDTRGVARQPCSASFSRGKAAICTYALFAATFLGTGPLCRTLLTATGRMTPLWSSDGTQPSTSWHDPLPGDSSTHSIWMSWAARCHADGVLHM